MKKIIFVFGTKFVPFAPQFGIAIDLCLEIEKNLSTKYVAIYDEVNSNIFLEQVLDGFELSSNDGIKDVIVLYCGNNFACFHNWRDCEAINLPRLVEKFIEIAGGYDTEEKKAIVHDLFMLGANMVLLKYQGVEKINILNKLAEAVGGRETEEKKKMAKDLFFGGVPRLMEV